MDDLDCRGEESGVVHAARGSIRREKENSAKALAAAEQTVTNGSRNVRRALVERSEPVADSGEGVVDLMAIRFDVADDAGVEDVGAAAVSHENR